MTIVDVLLVNEELVSPPEKARQGKRILYVDFDPAINRWSVMTQRLPKRAL